MKSFLFIENSLRSVADFVAGSLCLASVVAFYPILWNGGWTLVILALAGAVAVAIATKDVIPTVLTLVSIGMACQIQPEAGGGWQMIMSVVFAFCGGMACLIRSRDYRKNMERQEKTAITSAVVATGILVLVTAVSIMYVPICWYNAVLMASGFGALFLAVPLYYTPKLEDFKLVRMK